MKNEIKHNDSFTLIGTVKNPPHAATSINGDDFIRFILIVKETKNSNGETRDNFNDELMLIFWNKYFQDEGLKEILNLKEGQELLVEGMVGGRDNGLFRVVEFKIN